MCIKELCKSQGSNKLQFLSCIIVWPELQFYMPLEVLNQRIAFIPVQAYLPNLNDSSPDIPAKYYNLCLLIKVIKYFVIKGIFFVCDLPKYWHSFVIILFWQGLSSFDWQFCS